MPSLPGISLSSVIFEDIESFIADVSDEDIAVQSGVAITGEPANYALVWEYGNTRQQKKGPKTTLGINPNGERVWLTIQAPYGWIAINTPNIHNVIEQVLDELDFGDWKFGTIKRALKQASKDIAEKVHKILYDTAPVDSGDLRNSINVVVDIEADDIAENSSKDISVSGWSEGE